MGTGAGVATAGGCVVSAGGGDVVLAPAEGAGAGEGTGAGVGEVLGEAEGAGVGDVVSVEGVDPGVVVCAKADCTMLTPSNIAAVMILMLFSF